MHPEALAMQSTPARTGRLSESAIAEAHKATRWPREKRHVQATLSSGLSSSWYGYSLLTATLGGWQRLLHWACPCLSSSC